MLDLVREAEQLVHSRLVTPTPIDELRRRVRRRSHRRRATAGGLAIALAATIVGFVLIEPSDPNPRSKVTTATTPDRSPIPKLSDTSVPCAGGPPDTCVTAADGFSDLEMQTVGISRGYVSTGITYAEGEVNIASGRDSTCADGCREERFGETTQEVSFPEVARRVAALRSGVLTESRPDLRAASPCLGSKTDDDMRSFLGLAPGFAVRLAAENSLDLRTIGTNGVCHRSVGSRDDDRVTIDVFDGIVVGARRG